jgi:hypothetical protein
MEPAWKPSKLSARLPATVVGRPKTARSWDYVLEFSTGFELVASVHRETGRPSVIARLKKLGPQI